MAAGMKPVLACAVLLCAVLAVVRAYPYTYTCEFEAALDSAWMCKFCEVNSVNISSITDKEACDDCVLMYDGVDKQFTQGPVQASACYDCIAAFPNPHSDGSKRNDCYRCSKHVANMYATWACPWCANATLSGRNTSCYDCLLEIGASDNSTVAAAKAAACVDYAYGRSYCAEPLGHVVEKDCNTCVNMFEHDALLPTQDMVAAKKRDACYQMCSNTTLAKDASEALACLQCVEDGDVLDPWACQWCMQSFSEKDARQACYDWIMGNVPTFTISIPDFDNTDGSPTFPPRSPASYIPEDPNNFAEYGWSVAFCLGLNHTLEREICLDCLAAGTAPEVCTGGRWDPLTNNMGSVVAPGTDYIGGLAEQCYNTSSFYTPVGTALSVGDCRECQYKAGDKAWACTAVCRDPNLIEKGIGASADAIACAQCVVARDDPACAHACQNCLVQTLGLDDTESESGNIIGGTARDHARADCYTCVEHNPFTDAEDIGGMDWACGMCAKKSPDRRKQCMACLMSGYSSQTCLNLLPPPNDFYCHSGCHVGSPDVCLAKKAQLDIGTSSTSAVSIQLGACDADVCWGGADSGRDQAFFLRAGSPPLVGEPPRMDADYANVSVALCDPSSGVADLSTATATLYTVIGDLFAEVGHGTPTNGAINSKCLVFALPKLVKGSAYLVVLDGVAPYTSCDTAHSSFNVVAYLTTPVTPA